jgi:hypothetical protein
MKKFDKSGVCHDLSSIELVHDNPGDTQPNPPTVFVPSKVSPSFFLGPKKVSSNDIIFLIGGCFISIPNKVIDVLEKSTSGVCIVSDPVPRPYVDNITFFGPSFNTINHIPKTVESLSPLPLPVSNQTTLLPSASDRSNVNIRKKTRSCIPKVPPGATKGGLAPFGELALVFLEHDRSHTTVLPNSLEPNPDRISFPTLRES